MPKRNRSLGDSALVIRHWLLVIHWSLVIGHWSLLTRIVFVSTCILILVENLPVPLDRRVWQEACALRDAGYEVRVICPQMRGYTQPEEQRDGVRIYRH